MYVRMHFQLQGGAAATNVGALPPVHSPEGHTACVVRLAQDGIICKIYRYIYRIFGIYNSIFCRLYRRVPALLCSYRPWRISCVLIFYVRGFEYALMQKASLCVGGASNGCQGWTRQAHLLAYRTRMLWLQVVHVCAEHKKQAKLLKHLHGVHTAHASARHLPRVLVFANTTKVCCILFICLFLL
jgi:hypothetical protein